MSNKIVNELNKSKNEKILSSEKKQKEQEIKEFEIRK